MIANFTPSLLRLSQFIIVCGLLLLSACSYIDKLSNQQLEQEISTEQREYLQLEPAKSKIDKSLQQQATASDIELPTPHSPIYCSKSAEYPDQLPSVALSFYESSVRDVFAEISLLIDFPIVIDEFVEGVVTIETNNIRLDKALDLISATSNLSYRFFNEHRIQFWCIQLLDAQGNLLRIIRKIYINNAGRRLARLPNNALSSFSYLKNFKFYLKPRRVG